jgi:hypothetical protein
MNKPDLLCVTPQAGPVTLHPVPNGYVEIHWWDPVTPLQANLCKQWLLNEGWIAAAHNVIEYTFEG